MIDFGSQFKLSVRTVVVEYDATAAGPGPRLDQPANAAAFIEGWNLARVNTPDVEHFTVLGLDGNHRIIYAKTHATGTRNQAPVEAAAIFRDVLTAAPNAAGMILTHNHPSGDLEPSRDDLALTRRLVQGARLIGLDMLDHIITVPDGRWLSLRSGRADLFAV